MRRTSAGRPVDRDAHLYRPDCRAGRRRRHRRALPEGDPDGERGARGSTAASTRTPAGVHNYNGKLGLLGSGSVNPALALALNTTGNASSRRRLRRHDDPEPADAASTGSKRSPSSTGSAPAGPFVTAQEQHVPEPHRDSQPTTRRRRATSRAQNLQPRSVTLPPTLRQSADRPGPLGRSRRQRHLRAPAAPALRSTT